MPWDTRVDPKGLLTFGLHGRESTTQLFGGAGTPDVTSRCPPPAITVMAAGGPTRLLAVTVITGHFHHVHHAQPKRECNTHGLITHRKVALPGAGEYPTSPPTVPPLNPHGIAVDFKRRRMVTGDYLLPASTLIPTNGPVLRSTFRVWDLDSMEIISTYDVGELGKLPAPHVISDGPVMQVRLPG